MDSHSGKQFGVFLKPHMQPSYDPAIALDIYLQEMKTRVHPKS